MTAPITLTAYAKHRGVSTVSVSKAVARGRLRLSVGRDEHDRPTIVDVELADREWTANTRQRSDRTLLDVARETSQGTPAGLSGDGNSSKPIGYAGSNPAPDTKTRTGLPEGVPTYNVSQAVRAQAAARREAALADMAELELAAQRGKLVDADASRADVEQAYSLVKTRLLGVPSRLAQQMPDLAARVVPIVEALIRESLEELSDGAKSPHP